MRLTVGIDIGTTKCAAVIWDDEEKKILAVCSENHGADLKTVPEHAEQDPELLLDAVIRIVRQLPPDLRMQVSALGVTGQMHSVMGWNREKVFPLITWQDHRCDHDGKLEEFCRKSGHELHNGYGAATLAYMRECTAGWEYAATIMDYLTALLCGNERPVTDASNAASWGIFDLKKNQWDLLAAQALGIEKRLLPDIRETGSVVGHLSLLWSECLGFPAGIPVVNAVGDNQASILGTGKDLEKELFLTLGTGAQLSAVISNEEFEQIEPAGKLEIRPFDGTRKLAVCSALCGGRAFAWCGDMVRSVLTELGLPCPEFSSLLDRIDSLAVQALKNGESGLKMIPSFLGERSDPELRGIISGLTLKNFSPGNLGAAAADGILENLIADFPAGVLEKRSLILGSGNGIRKVRVIQLMIGKKFRQQFILTDTREEACCGAAILAGRSIG